MSNAETSAYLLMAAGVFWLLVGIMGVLRGVKSKDELPPERHLDEERDTSTDEQRAPELRKRSASRWDAAPSP